jgi:hypothetical protein
MIMIQGRPMKYLPMLLVVLLSLNCLERKMPSEIKTDSVFELVKNSVPAIVNPGRSYLISVKVAGTGQADVKKVRLDIFKENMTEKLLSLTLYDDGDAAAGGNGDVVAFDGIYSQRLSWPAASGNNRLTFQFSIDESSVATIKIPVSSQDVKPPVINLIVLPDTLQSGFNGQKSIQVAVVDSTGVDDIWGVLLSGFQNGNKIFVDTLYDDGSHGDPTARDGICTLIMNNSFAAGKKGGYELQFQAVDKAGLTSSIVKRNMQILNGVPIITQVNLVEEVSRPVSGTVTILIEALVQDPQGLADIKQVKLTWKKPDGSYPAASPYVLFDNGLVFDISRWDYGYRGDVKANDGTFSIRGVFDSTNQLGIYTLGVQAEDLVGNKTAEIFYKVTLKSL